MVQFVAFGGALLFERIAALIGAKRAIVLSLVIWCGVVLYAYCFLQTKTEAWLMGAVIAVVLGGSQALSRSLFSRMIRRARGVVLRAVRDLGARHIVDRPADLRRRGGATNSYRQAILSLIVLLVMGFMIAFTNTRQAVREAEGQPA